jgi:hypothetical protein
MMDAAFMMEDIDEDVFEVVDVDVVMDDGTSLFDTDIDMDVDVYTSTVMEVDDTDPPPNHDNSMDLDGPFLTFPPTCLVTLSSWIDRNLSKAFQHAVSILPMI